MTELAVRAYNFGISMRVFGYLLIYFIIHPHIGARLGVDSVFFFS